MDAIINKSHPLNRSFYLPLALYLIVVMGFMLLYNQPSTSVEKSPVDRSIGQLIPFLLCIYALGAGFWFFRSRFENPWDLSTRQVGVLIFSLLSIRILFGWGLSEIFIYDDEWGAVNALFGTLLPFFMYDIIRSRFHQQPEAAKLVL